MAQSIRFISSVLVYGLWSRIALTDLYKNFLQEVFYTTILGQRDTLRLVGRKTAATWGSGIREI